MKYLLILILMFTFPMKAETEWKEGIFLTVDGNKECSLGIYNENKSYLSLILSKKKSGKRNIRLQLRSNLEIINDGKLVVNLIFKSKNEKKEVKKRVRFLPYSKYNTKVFKLNSKSITKESFNEIMDLLIKFDTVNVVAYDKKWVEFNFKFSLKNSKNVFESVFLKCA